MVARAWPVSVEVIQDWLMLPRVKRAHPHVSTTPYPEISFELFQWKSMGRVAKVL